jgi:RNA polymerase sigma factor (sigma-70 family)
MIARMVEPEEGPEHAPGPAGAGGLTSHHVHRALRGDAESLAWIVTHLTPIFRAQAAWRLGPRLRDVVDPDDVVADAWLVVLGRLGDLDRLGGRATPRLVAFVGTTILRIANRRIDTFLRRATGPLPADAGSPEDAKAADPTGVLQASITGAVTNAARAELGAALERGLADLSEKDREVVLLRVAEGLSNEEAARELGEAPNTVSHRYRRALEKLRKAMPDSFFDDFSGT